MVNSPRLPGTLTQMLRKRDDAQLEELLAARPDLALPPPSDMSQIASRATTRHSVTAALDTLNVFELWVAALASRLPLTLGRTTFAATEVVEAAEERGAGDPLGVGSVVERLLGLSLLWGDHDEMRPVRAMSSMLGDVPLAAPPPSTPPSFEEAPTQSTGLVDKVAAGSAFEFVRRMDVLVEHCGQQPAKLLRGGGLSSRDVRGLASLLDMSPALAAAEIEIGQACGLLARTVQDLDEVLLPTAEFDDWQGLDLAEQWVRLVDTWFERHPSSGPASLKRLCLDAFGEMARGRVLAGDDLRAWLRWQRPRRVAGSDRQAMTMLDQAAWIGVTGMGALASFAPGLDAATLAHMLPPRVDHVLVQADLTAVAPGPLTPDAARDLGALADVESRGGATVYRFSAASVKHAWRLGWTVDDILAALRRWSRTPIPQPLEYLVRDLDRQSAPRRAAASQPAAPGAPPGARMRRRTDDRRRRPGRDSVTSPGPPADDSARVEQLDAGRLREIVSLVRRGDDPPTTSEVGSALGSGPEPGRRRDRAGRAGPETTLESPLATLREAVETGEVVWFGYVDPRGTSGERLVHASSVDEGLLEARDSSTRESLRVPLHRITAAHIIRGVD